MTLDKRKSKKVFCSFILFQFVINHMHTIGKFYDYKLRTDFIGKMRKCDVIEEGKINNLQKFLGIVVNVLLVLLKAHKKLKASLKLTKTLKLH